MSLSRLAAFALPVALPLAVALAAEVGIRFGS